MAQILLYLAHFSFNYFLSFFSVLTGQNTYRNSSDMGMSLKRPVNSLGLVQKETKRFNKRVN